MERIYNWLDSGPELSWKLPILTVEPIHFSLFPVYPQPRLFCSNRFQQWDDVICLGGYDPIRSANQNQKGCAKITP